MHIPGILSWNWSVGLLTTGIILIAGYIWMNRFKSVHKTLLFISSMILAEIALALPLGPKPPSFQASALSCCLPGGILLSVHMIRSIMLLMLVPPLFVASLPEEPVRKLLSNNFIEKMVGKLSNPVLTWMVGLGVMWFWHIPPVFNYLTTYGTSLGHTILPEINVISLLIGGMFLAWPILSPLKEYRLSPLKGSLYLFLACTGCSVLGMTIAFASPGFYHTAFSSQPGPIWGLSQKVDQQVGGLLMWVPGCFIYVTGVMVLMVRWFSGSEATQTSISHLQETTTTA